MTFLQNNSLNIFKNQKESSIIANFNFQFSWFIIIRKRRTKEEERRTKEEERKKKKEEEEKEKSSLLININSLKY